MKLGYDISSGGAPSTDQTGQDTLSSDQIGGFVHRIAVNLAGHISGAQIQATDVASDKTATRVLGSANVIVRPFSRPAGAQCWRGAAKNKSKNQRDDCRNRHRYWQAFDISGGKRFVHP